jgi:hypothetical protein
VSAISLASMRCFIFLSLLYLLSPGLSEVIPLSRGLTTTTATSETTTSTTTTRALSPPTPPSLSPNAVPSPTTTINPPSPSSSLARARNGAAAVPTQRPSGLFNSFTCVAIKPYMVCGIVTWSTMNCSTVMDEYEFLAGNCCPLNDYGTSGCRLEVNGPNSFCSYKTRYDRRYYSYLIAPSNTGKCLTSQYQVQLPPSAQPTAEPRSAPTTATTQSTYGACFQASYLSCAGASCAGTTNTTTSTVPYAFRRAYNRCARSSPYKSSRCVQQASAQCNARAGRAPLPVCAALPALGRSGTLVQAACVRLRRRCRAATESVVCA